VTKAILDPQAHKVCKAFAEKPARPAPQVPRVRLVPKDYKVNPVYAVPKGKQVNPVFKVPRAIKAILVP